MSINFSRVEEVGQIQITQVVVLLSSQMLDCIQIHCLFCQCNDDMLDCIQMILCFMDDVVNCGYSDDIVDLWMILWICECNDDIELYIVNV